MRFSFVEISSTTISRMRRAEIFAVGLAGRTKRSPLINARWSWLRRSPSGDSSRAAWKSCGLLHLDDARGRCRWIVSDLELDRVFARWHKRQVEQHGSRGQYSGCPVLLPANVQWRRSGCDAQRVEGASQQAHIHRSDRQRDRKRAIRRSLSIELPEQSNFLIAPERRPTMYVRNRLVEIPW